MTSVSPSSGSTAGGTTVTITGIELCYLSDGDVWRDCGNERGGGEQYIHHGHNSSGNRGRGNGNGNGRCAER